MRNQLSHTVCVHTVGFIICGSYKIALYTVLLESAKCHSIRYVENVQTWLPTL